MDTTLRQSVTVLIIMGIMHIGLSGYTTLANADEPEFREIDRITLRGIALYEHDKTHRSMCLYLEILIQNPVMFEQHMVEREM